MKVEFADVSETRKTVTIEIPREKVDTAIDRVARDYSKDARIPGFRKGKVPPSVIKQRFRDQILHDVTQDLIPRAVRDVLQERSIEPIDTPGIQNISLAEGQPLTFTATVDTVPSFDPGDLTAIELRRSREAVTDEAVHRALDSMRERAARYEPVDGRPVADGDTVTMDLVRAVAGSKDERNEGASVLIGGPGNPPGFDEQVVGMGPGNEKTFNVFFPADYPVPEMQGTSATYTVTVKEVRRRALPALDAAFARDLGEFDSLAALRERVRTDLEAQAEETSQRQLRQDLLKQLSERVTFEPPDSLVEAELDRRLRELVEQMMAQNVDPRQAGVDWGQFRESQRETARGAVRAALALDEVARREGVQVAAEDVDKEIERFAERVGRTPDAIRAQLEKEGRISSLQTGLRREKAVEVALARARITDE